MGKFNSSHTRVRPFFRALSERDPHGTIWLANLLALAPNREVLDQAGLEQQPGSITKMELDPEKRLQPPEAFLRWLIENPARMTWPKGKVYGEETQRWREALVGRTPLSQGDQPERSREEAQREALAELRREGSSGSDGRWWAFEGMTCVDCFIETDLVRLYIEGKRTETLSRSTNWFPSRNQLMRNLESASQDSGERPFACLIIAEDRNLNTPDPQESWPHLTAEQQANLMKHFLGVITWRDACAATEIAYETLPHTT